MSLLSQGLLLTMMDAPNGQDAEFNEWANQEHIPERKEIAGFRSALRFENVQSSPRYLAIYDLDDISVLKSPAYLAIAGENLSPWSKRILAGVSSHWRFAGSRITSLPDGAPTGPKGPVAELLLVVWRGVPEKCDGAVGALLDAQVRRLPGIVQARAFVAENESRFDYVAIVESSEVFPAPECTDPQRYSIGSRPCDLVRVFSPLPASGT